MRSSVTCVVLTIVHIILGNYNQVGHLLNKHDALEEEERKIARGDFKHLHPAGKRKESTIIANMLIQDIIDQIAKSASSEAVNDASSAVCR